ncbi:PIN domain-containing protein [Geobacter sp. DSM 9736]|uniref:PIN domain-containing protein n=1 Tax=Geobacter sp. DSM 9736 TaxID=1277350 RepID=UPI000B5E4613|nr:PIN domain-containing protein [Geobacter sp. DSM 9736]SNB46507.1 PIN domain-containing protein [Geobacter sp. DSM 9736]
MSIFIDTSGFLAVLDSDDSCHEKARAEWLRLLDSDHDLISSSYILVETIAVLQKDWVWKRCGCSRKMWFRC